MNPDTAPIAEIEEWLAPRLGWTKHPSRQVWYHYEKGHSAHGVLIGPSMDAAIGCLPEGCHWQAYYVNWLCVKPDHWVVEHPRSNDPAKARDELLRLAVKAWMAKEVGRDTNRT